jgi:hypothetical protein
MSPRYLENLNAIAADISLTIEYRPTRRRRGWPEPSAKPWGLYWLDGGRLVAAFATADLLERNLRARAGC